MEKKNFSHQSHVFSSILSIMKVDLTIGTKYYKLLALNIHIKTSIKKDNDLAVIKKDIYLLTVI